LQLPRTREWRLTRGMSQRGLAAAAGLGQMTIHRIEDGGSAWPSTASKIAEALSVEVRDLLDTAPLTTEEQKPADLTFRRVEREEQQAKQTVALARIELGDEYNLSPQETTVLNQLVRYEQFPVAIQAIVRPLPTKKGERKVDMDRVYTVLDKMIERDLLSPEQLKSLARSGVSSARAS
jgi:transcriptional regulator with XRE-family HTH domain